MLTNLASYLLGYLGEPVQTPPTREGDNVAPNRTHDSDDDSWLLVDIDEENDESVGRLVRVSRSASTSSLPCQPMDESWFLTPPPCFTSTAPSDMENSPLENLLIEHPSMSVYHRHTSRRTRSVSPPPTSPLPPPAAYQPQQRQPLAPVTDQQALQCFDMRPTNKYHKMPSLQMTRNQLERSNKVREVNSRSRRLRRSDRQNQHSGANNNRKCC